MGESCEGPWSRARLELPVLRLDHRSESPRQRGVSNREEDRLGLPEPARPECARGGPLHQETRVPEGLGRHPAWSPGLTTPELKFRLHVGTDVPAPRRN